MDAIVTLKFSYNGINLDVDVSANEDTISNSIRRTGAWEPWQLEVYNSLLKESKAPIVLDVGANVGINSMYISKLLSTQKKDTAIYAVEPGVRNFKLLMANLAKNDIKNVKPHNLAISNSTGHIQFSGDETNGHIAREDQINFSYSVRSMTLDEFAKSENLMRIDLIKVDVEGYTDLVLYESDQTINKTENVILEFSIGDTQTRHEFTQIEAEKTLTNQAKQLGRTFPYTYYLSRQFGPVEIVPSEAVSILKLEDQVGDFLFSRHEIDSISTQDFLIRLITKLQFENHLRILEIQTIATPKRGWTFSSKKRS